MTAVTVKGSLQLSYFCDDFFVRYQVAFGD